MGEKTLNLLCIMLYVLFCTSGEVCGRRSLYSYSSIAKDGDDYYSNTGECKSRKLTCVPSGDCDLECPPSFTKLGGACYFISTDDFNPKRTLSEAEDYCRSIHSDLLWIEDSKELTDLLLLLTSLEDTTSLPVNEVSPIGGDIVESGVTTTDPITTTTEPENPGNGNMTATKYFIASDFMKSKGSWVWKGNDYEINWDILLYDTPNSSQSLENIKNFNINKCLVLHPSGTSEGGLVKQSECIAKHHYICKMGEARARCSKSASTKCCYSPSYDFYIQNRGYGLSNLNFRPGNCQVKLNEDQQDCTEVIATIRNKIEKDKNLYALARIDSSFFYIASPESPCIGREAVVQNQRVHDFITLLLATKEKVYETQNVKIGLTFELENQMAYWVNGKPQEYYDQFWYPGEPKRDESVDGGCAAYSNLPETSTYLWRLFSKERCQNFSKVCELPIAKKTSEYKEETTCGQRQERGVLAKTLHSVYSTDEANFGEFPWQAAIMYPEKYGREVKRRFACSGALIHKSFVLTSAHCVTSLNVQKDFVVVLGQNDLHDDSYILEPLVLDVKEIILHNDFNVRESALHDVALLQLDEDVNEELYPHIGLGCLPDPEEIRSHGGDWECFITGWTKDGYRRSILKRIEAEFTSEEYCHYLNKDYYRDLAYDRRYKRIYNKYHRSNDPELLCTTPYKQYCLDDTSPLLVCKKETTYIKKPFYGTSHHTKQYKFDHSSKGKIHHKNKDLRPGKFYSTKSKYEDDVIVNAYGEDRFDNDKWYIIGIGNAKSECRKSLSYQHGYESHGYGERRRPYSFNLYGDYDGHLYRSAESKLQKPFVENIVIENYDNQKDFVSKDKAYKDKVHKDQYKSDGYDKGREYHRRYLTEVFTSVYDYIDFIYYILDLNH